MMPYIVFYFILLVFIGKIARTIKKAYSDFDTNRPGQTGAPQPASDSGVPTTMPSELPSLSPWTDSDKPNIDTDVTLEELITSMLNKKNEEEVKPSSMVSMDAELPVEEGVRLIDDEPVNEAVCVDIGVSDSGNDIRLQTPAEARRAFIYSEIFKRKYL